jgi:ASCH domain
VACQQRHKRKHQSVSFGRERRVRSLRLKIGNQCGGHPHRGYTARYLNRSSVRSLTDVAVQCLRKGSVSSFLIFGVYERQTEASQNEGARAGVDCLSRHKKVRRLPTLTRSPTPNREGRSSGVPSKATDKRNDEGTPMKILSILQPWAHLIVSGSKNIENRTWSTSYRGPFLVQASLNVNREACHSYRLNHWRPGEL